MLPLQYLHQHFMKCIKFAAISQIRHHTQFQIKVKPTTSLQLPHEVVPVFRRAVEFPERTALKDSFSSYTYGNLFMSAKELSKKISADIGGKTNERVIFLCPNDANYVITQWAIWMSGHIAIPMSRLHPQSMLEYYCEDSNPKLLITTSESAEVMQATAKVCNKKLLVLDDNLRQSATRKIPKKIEDLEGGFTADFYSRHNAMILYTSGTTGSPKGVVLSHKNLQSQMVSLIDAWKWTNNDVILHVLPLHHVHGIVNALMCPLYIGAKCTMLPKFDSNAVWSSLLSVNTAAPDRITTFMAVPTIYSKLVQEYERIFSKNPRMVEYIKTTLKTKIRLMVSGSAPLPAPVFENWYEITGHKLLERYGMTEIGMCLSNSYDADREPGYIGLPLPGVSVRLAEKKDNGEYKTLVECSQSWDNDMQFKYDKQTRADLVGELLVKGDSVFKEYFNRPEATEKEFTSDGWFKTGDTAQFSIKKKLFRILGRTSIDIIKTGGFKVSALQIETHMLGHPDVEDIAVVGLNDATWGQKVGAVIVLKKDREVSIDDLKKWAKTKMASYAVPSVIKFKESIPKNAMGKTNKKEVMRIVFPENL